MLARPAAIAAMSFADRFATRAIYDGAAARVVAHGGLNCERFACGFDGAERSAKKLTR